MVQFTINNSQASCSAVHTGAEHGKFPSSAYLSSSRRCPQILAQSKPLIGRLHPKLNPSSAWGWVVCTERKGILAEKCSVLLKIGPSTFKWDQLSPWCRVVGDVYISGCGPVESIHSFVLASVSNSDLIPACRRHHGTKPFQG